VSIADQLPSRSARCVDFAVFHDPVAFANRVATIATRLTTPVRGTVPDLATDMPVRGRRSTDRPSLTRELDRAARPTGSPRRSQKVPLPQGLDGDDSRTLMIANLMFCGESDS
jgi:hypothetical protein